MKLTKVMDGDEAIGSPACGRGRQRARNVLERFAGKRFAILEPMGLQKGTYKLEDNKLSVTADGTTTAVNVACMGSMINFETPNGPMRFVRFQ